MTFQPRMQNSIEGFSVIGGFRRRIWNGIVADLWDVECAAYAGGYYVARDPRLFILLDHSGEGRPQVKLSPTRSGGVQDRLTSPISYIPAGMELWVDIADMRTIRHLDIHFDADTVASRLGVELDPDRVNAPRLLFSDERVVSLSRLIAAELSGPGDLHDLYGDSLALATVIDVLKVARRPERKRGGLAAWQLRRVQDFITENCGRPIRLQELADLTGLSQSHFSHSFKASTGLAPHEWQMKARLDNARGLILKGDLPLAAVAAEAGFGDQAHFTRAFRKHFGTTPAKWQKTQR